MTNIEDLKQGFLRAVREVFDYEDWCYEDGHIALIGRYVSALEAQAGVESSGLMERLAETIEEARDNGYEVEV